jgi:hypothetical protein
VDVQMNALVAVKEISSVRKIQKYVMQIMERLLIIFIK